ncbi:MAG: NADH-quinone oxidoreductase subunit A [Bacteroidia bacterium]|nr:NADH-quinone oxidoreductase subunit A [Bacteroidia bacterium]
MPAEYTYVPFLVILALGLGLALALALLTQGLGPSRPKETKMVPYESGMDPVGTARDRFSIKFYLVAMLFIIFDIEVVFMYPWAVQYKQLGLFAFVEMLVFVGILFVGYIYLVKKEGLKWD